ncbi:MAG: Mrp/NBP35 family ATP-binding protein [Deltaproteobacteria bacterium]|nr:Mrp/NBP35 family ATP-binding protein [Deltaproteobacteria bacterium]
MNKEQILEALKTVKYPGIDRDIISFGFVKDVLIQGDSVKILLQISTKDPANVRKIEDEVRATVQKLSGVKSVELDSSLSKAERSPEKGPDPWAGRAPIPGVKNIIAVASGKGGVGKSTVAVNLAVALRELGYRIGIMDSDIYGPSLPIMMGLHQRPLAQGNQIIPLEKDGMKLMSVGFLLDDKAPVIWRGPMVTQMVQQFLRNVRWGDLDFLVIDLPPGTGDTQLTLVQTCPLSGAIIVTTPQDVALVDARRGLEMFNKVNTRVLGIVENMSYFHCPHCGGRTDIFGSGGGERVAAELGIPLLGEISLDPAIREGGDSGNPIVQADPESPQTKAFKELAIRVAGLLESSPV